MSGSSAILISGASTGIGQCCSEVLAAKGYKVFAGVRRTHDGERLASLAPGIIPVILDVTNADSVRYAFEQVADKLSRAGLTGLTGLINNAGIVVGGPMEFVPLDALREQLEINLVGHVAVTQTFLPLLRQARGRIVNMGSIAGLTSLPFVAPYSISKFALEALSDAMRLELRPWGIEVSLIEPGSIATPLWGKAVEKAEALSSQVPPEVFSLYGEALEKIKAASQVSGQRGLPPERVAEAVVHALTARRPKTRYLVGPDARLRYLLNALPDRLKDRLIAWKVGLKY